jgi:hypothetical protein
MDNFKEVGKELQASCKAEATGMMRNFCVLTLEAGFTPNTGKWSSEFTNHRVLVGSAAKVDAVKAKIEEKMGAATGEKGWNFKLNEQYHKQ